MVAFIILSSIETICLFHQEQGLWAFDTVFFGAFLIANLIVLYYSSTLLIFHIQIIYKGLTSVENLRISNNPGNAEFQVSKKKSHKDTLENTFGSNLWSCFLPTGMEFIYVLYAFNFLLNCLI